MSRSDGFYNRVEDFACLNRAIRDRVKSFSTSGRSAQLLLLENGCWAQLNQWMEHAIVSKDSLLVKEILNAVWTMPTSWSQVNANRKGLPATVQELLKSLVAGNEVFESESDSVKLLCAEVFARWLRIKKHKTEETDNERIYVDADENKSEIALVKNKPGYGFVTQSGNIALVQLKPYQLSSLPLKKRNSSLYFCPEFNFDSVSLNNQEASLPAAKKFCSSFDSKKMEQKIPQLVSPQSSSEISQVDQIDNSCSFHKANYTTPITSTPTKYSAPPMFEMHETSLEKIAHVSDATDKNAIRLWEALNGENKVYECESMSAGSTKDKKVSKSIFNSDDEYETAEARLVTDEEHENENIDAVNLDETMEAPRLQKASSSSENARFVSKNEAPWKVYKIHFPPNAMSPDVKSREEQVQNVREGMVIKVNLEPGFSIPDHPVEGEDFEVIKDADDDDVANTTLVLISSKDVVNGEIMGVLNTVVDDHRTEQWPCGKNQ